MSETREQLMRDFDVREERVDAIRADRWRCDECHSESFVRDSGRFVEIGDALVHICNNCVDDILREALR
jgi:hypothetical protein